MKARLFVTATAAAAATLLLAAPAMAETCASSTPSQAAFPHTPQEQLVPKVVAIQVTVDGACQLTVQDTVTDRPSGLIDGDSLAWYLNTDGNPSTGSPLFAGADFVVMLLGSYPDRPMLIPYASGEFDVEAGTPVARTGFGFTVNINQLNATPGAFTMVGVSQWRGIRSYTDFIPPVTSVQASSVSFPVAFTPTATPAPATDNPTAAPNVEKPACRPPRLIGKSLRAARRAITRAGCQLGTITRPSSRRGRLVVVKQRSSGDRVSITLGVKRHR
jgi:hypothetical protein